MFQACRSAIAFAVVAIGAILAPPADAATLQALVPSYFYPSGAGATYWSEMTTAAAQITLTAILNPNSGPGASADPNYVSAVNSLRAAGGRVIGYVYTSYGARSLADVEADVSSYASFYNLDGVFVDEMGNTAGSVGYYASLYSAIKSAHPSWTVFGNPGTTTLEQYVTAPAADTLAVFESDGANYPSYTPSPWNFSYAANHFAHLLYNVPTATAMQSDVALAATRNAGFVFVTDANLPNPYDALPSYWDQEVSKIESVNTLPEPGTLTLLCGALLACGTWVGAKWNRRRRLRLAPE